MSVDQNTLLLKAITSLDLTIRELTAAVKASPKAAPVASTSTFKPSGEIPQPTEIIENAGEEEIHFGKNSGVALGTLSEKQLSWYAAEQEVKTKSNGEPFLPRSQDVLMRNAARTLWHQKKGTLNGAVSVAENKTTESEESVPF